MKIILDTRTALWFLTGSNRLSQSAKLAIEEVQDDIGVSVVSLWEFTIKHSLKKLEYSGGVMGFSRALAANKWAILPITGAHLKALEKLPLLHRDPFDRMLIATAVAEQAVLVSGDENIHQYEIDCLW